MSFAVLSKGINSDLKFRRRCFSKLESYRKQNLLALKVVRFFLSVQSFQIT